MDNNKNTCVEILEDACLSIEGMLSLAKTRLTFAFILLDAKKQRHALATILYANNEIEEVFQTMEEELFEILGEENWNKIEKHLDNIASGL